MTELETIFQRHSTLGVYSQVRRMNPDQFKSALTEVLKLVEVTDEQIETSSELHFEAQQEIYFRLGAKWSRDLQKQKLQKLIE
jgi:hypothetical protein